MYYARADNKPSTPKSFFVVYTAANYAIDETGKSYLVPSNPMSGSTEVIRTDAPIRSFQGFVVEKPGIVVFQHHNYKGNGHQFQTTAQSIDDYFDYDQRDGVSSYIVTGGKWKLCLEENLQGACFIANEGEMDPTIDIVTLNDRVRSLTPVRNFWSNEIWAE